MLSQSLPLSLIIVFFFVTCKRLKARHRCHRTSHSASPLPPTAKTFLTLTTHKVFCPHPRHKDVSPRTPGHTPQPAPPLPTIRIAPACGAPLPTLTSPTVGVYPMVAVVATRRPRVLAWRVNRAALITTTRLKPWSGACVLLMPSIYSALGGRIGVHAYTLTASNMRL
jgi:hypothetical protein